MCTRQTCTHIFVHEILSSIQSWSESLNKRDIFDILKPFLVWANSSKQYDLKVPEFRLDLLPQENIFSHLHCKCIMIIQ